MEKPRLKVLLHVSDTRGGGDYSVGRVARMESSGDQKPNARMLLMSSKILCQGNKI